MIALIGPTGVGKTTTIAKLAANFKLREQRRVGLITIDTYRIAAVDQLRTYAEHHRRAAGVVLTPGELHRGDRVDERQGRGAHRHGRAEPERRHPPGAAPAVPRAAQPDQVHLVLSATANQKNVQAAVEKFSHLGVDRVLLTKLDEAVSFGMILNVVRRTNAALSYVTTGPGRAGRHRGHAKAVRSPELIVGGSGV